MLPTVEQRQGIVSIKVGLFNNECIARSTRRVDGTTVIGIMVAVNHCLCGIIGVDTRYGA